MLELLNMKIDLIGIIFKFQLSVFQCDAYSLIHFWMLLLFFNKTHTYSFAYVNLVVLWQKKNVKLQFCFSFIVKVLDRYCVERKLFINFQLEVASSPFQSSWTSFICSELPSFWVRHFLNSPVSPLLLISFYDFFSWFLLASFSHTLFTSLRCQQSSTYIFFKMNTKMRKRISQLVSYFT